MTCHCDFREDCCCQEEVHTSCSSCKKWIYIASTCLVVGIVAAIIIARKS